MEPYNLQYLNIYIHTCTHIGYMTAYYVHIENINSYTIHTHTRHENIPKIIHYIYTHTYIHTCTYIYSFIDCYTYIRTYAYNVTYTNFTNIHALHMYIHITTYTNIDTHMVIHTIIVHICIHIHTLDIYIHIMHILLRHIKSCALTHAYMHTGTYIHIPHITIYIGHTGSYKLQYFHTHTHTHTHTLDICMLTHTLDNICIHIM